MAFSRILPLLDCHKTNKRTNFENLNGKNLDIGVKICFTPKKLFFSETDFTATYLKVPPKPKYLSVTLICSG